jgi:hypothetical protein
VAWQITKPKWIESVADDSFLGICFSIIPGLGHFLYGRFRSIVWLFGIWFVLILASIFMYGSTLAMFFFGLAVGIHALIAISCSYLEQEKAFLRRIGVMAVLSIVFGILYNLVGGLIFSDFAGQYSAMNFESYKVKYGDLLLARSGSLRQENLFSGDLVLARAALIGYGRQFGRNDALVVGQIIGLPNDVVTIRNGVYYLNNNLLDPGRFPVPKWLRNGDISVTIPADSYFLSCEYTIAGNNFVLNNYIQQTCVITKERVEGKVFMRWLPLSRRGFIKVSR